MNCDKENKVSRGQIRKAIKGLIIGKDNAEIMKKVAELMGKDTSNFDVVMEETLYYNGCYNLAMAAKKEELC